MNPLHGVESNTTVAPCSNLIVGIHYMELKVRLFYSICFMKIDVMNPLHGVERAMDIDIPPGPQSVLLM